MFFAMDSACSLSKAKATAGMEAGTEDNAPRSTTFFFGTTAAFDDARLLLLPAAEARTTAGLTAAALVTASIVFDVCACGFACFEVQGEERCMGMQPRTKESTGFDGRIIA